jgi:hypothetical protein
VDHQVVAWIAERVGDLLRYLEQLG